MPNHNARLWFIASLQVFGVLGCGGSPQETSTEPASPIARLSKALEQPPTPPAEKPIQTNITIDAASLWRAYGQNVVAADGQYTGKQIKVTGTADKIAADADGHYFVALFTPSMPPLSPQQVASLTPQQAKWFNQGCPPAVIGYLDNDKRADFAAVKPRQKIEVSAIAKGMKTDREAMQGYVIVLERCVLVHKPVESPDQTGASK